MSYCVHLHVCFRCNVNDGVATLAKAHLETLEKTDETFEARWLLEDLANRTGENLGSKGGLSLWGIVGSHVHADEFVNILRPFWADLLSGIENGPLAHEHVVVFYEEEQSDQACAYEIGWDEPGWAGRQLVITHHELPFAWGQG